MNKPTIETERQIEETWRAFMNQPYDHYTANLMRAAVEFGFEAGRKSRDPEIDELRKALRELVNHEFCECGCEGCYECAKDSNVKMHARLVAYPDKALTQGGRE